MPVIPDQDVSSQYWDILPSAVRVARDAAHLMSHTGMEAANGAAGGEVADSEANAADADGEESAGGEQEGGGEEAASEAHGAFTQGHEQAGPGKLPHNLASKYVLNQLATFNLFVRTTRQQMLNRFSQLARAVRRKNEKERQHNARQRKRKSVPSPKHRMSSCGLETY